MRKSGRPCGAVWCRVVLCGAMCGAVCCSVSRGIALDSAQAKIDEEIL